MMLQGGQIPDETTMLTTNTHVIVNPSNPILDFPFHT